MAETVSGTPESSCKRADVLQRTDWEKQSLLQTPAEPPCRSPTLWCIYGSRPRGTQAEDSQVGMGSRRKANSGLAMGLLGHQAASWDRATSAPGQHPTTYLRTWTGSPPFTCPSELSPHIGETSQKMQTRSCHFLTEDPQWCPTVLKLNSRPWHLRLLTLTPCPLSVPVLWPH